MGITQYANKQSEDRRSNQRAASAPLALNALSNAIDALKKDPVSLPTTPLSISRTTDHRSLILPQVIWGFKDKRRLIEQLCIVLNCAGMMPRTRVHLLNTTPICVDEKEYKVGVDRYTYLTTDIETLTSILNRYGCTFVSHFEQDPVYCKETYYLRDNLSSLLNRKLKSAEERLHRLKQKLTLHIEDATVFAGTSWPIRYVTAKELFSVVSQQTLEVLEQSKDGLGAIPRVDIVKKRQRFNYIAPNGIETACMYDSTSMSHVTYPHIQVEFEFVESNLDDNARITAITPILKMLYKYYGVNPNANNCGSKLDWIKDNITTTI